MIRPGYEVITSQVLVKVCAAYADKLWCYLVVFVLVRAIKRLLRHESLYEW